jgi:protein-tyrosine-phosphatase
MRREHFDLVIPTDEIGVRALHEHGDELERWGRLCRPSDQACRVLLDKAQTAQLAHSLGLRVSAQQGSDGQLVGVGLLLDEGEPLLAFQYVHVHEPLPGTRGTYVKSVPLTPELLEATLELMRAIAFTGVAAVEFRLEPATHSSAAIDVNAHFSGSLPLALAAGVDLPMGLFGLLVDGATPEPYGYRTGVHSRNLSGDMVWLLSNVRASGYDPTLTTRLLRDTAFELIRNVLRRREHFDAFSIDDPLPLVVESGQTLRKGIKLLQRRARRRLAASTLLRRRLARGAVRAVRDADTVLFVCVGNICRSPFAERRARALGIFSEVASAGHDASEESHSPPLAIKAAKDWDVQLAPHRSRRLVEAQVQAADVVFVFDEDNEQRFIDRFPFARDRVHYIGALREHGPLIVDDPFGGDLGVFERTYAEIEAALNAMARIRGHRRGRP